MEYVVKKGRHMKLDGVQVVAVDSYRALSWSVTYAITEAQIDGILTDAQASTLTDRMNEIMNELIDGKVVRFNPTSKRFEGVSRDKIESEPGDDTLTDSDVLVIKGGQ